MLSPTLPADVQLIALDQDPHALAFWQAAGAITVTNTESLAKFPAGRVDVVPCDEYTRLATPWVHCSRTRADLAIVHHKGAAYDRLSAAKPRRVRLPARLPAAVLRPTRGAGSRGLKISAPDELVTAYVRAKREYVIDADTRADLYSPRITFQLKHGSDTYVSVLGPAHPRYPELCAAAREVLELLGVDGIANVQLIEDADGALWFVEASARFSGSAWVNTRVGLNLWTGDDQRAPTLVRQRLHTYGGGLLLPADHHEDAR